MGQGLFPLGLVGRLSEAYFLAGQLDRADQLVRLALELARQHKQPGFEAWTLRLLGEIHMRRDPSGVESVEAAYRQALALAEKLEMRPLIAHCHLGLGRLYRRMGRRPAADHLIPGTTLLREMNMRLWLAPAEAEANEMGPASRR